MNKSAVKKIKSEDTMPNDGIRRGIPDFYFLLALLFFFSGLFFYFFGNYVFFYQENQMLFVFSGEYFEQFAVKPGGLLEYAGNFLSQYYFSKLYGAIILATIYSLLAFTFFRINKKISGSSSFSIIFSVIPSCLLVLMQTNFNYMLHNNLGILLAASWFLFSLSSDKKWRLIVSLALFPLLLYVAGAFSWIYLGMFILYNLMNRKLFAAVFMGIIAFLSFLVFRNLIFLQPWSELLYYPLPLKDYFKNPAFFYSMSGFIILYPLLFRWISLIEIPKEYLKTISVYGSLLIFSVTLFFLSRIYSPATADLFKLEKLLCEQDWNGIIKYQETKQSPNMIAQYYYNIALSEKGVLCSRMFFGRQDYGTKSVMIPWDSRASMNKMFRGVYFFYTIGLINEAHRWAFESMVVQGYHPENIKLLIKTDLINGHYAIAKKYIYVLKKTLHYRGWAKKYEAMLNKPELIKSDPELGEKIKLLPKHDFPIKIKNQQTNITFLLESNPGNRKAFEYKLAWFMLEKNIRGVINDIGKFKEMGYSEIPRHVEEAALFFSSEIGQLPDLGGLIINPETKSRFDQFGNWSRSNMVNNQIKPADIPVIFRNTYWYYLNIK